jgi:hypothetical protein
MSFMMIKDIVQTSILSKRWKNLWKHLPDLKLSTFEFNNPRIFGECISGIVSSRSKGNYPLRSLDFNRHGCFQNKIFTDLITYTISRGLKILKVVVPANLGLPNCVFISHSLTSLHISGTCYDHHKRNRLPMYLDLPALTSLHLDCVTIQTDHNGHAEPFSTCTKLKYLFIDNCCSIHPKPLSFNVKGILHIKNATLIDLTIKDTSYATYKYVIFTPNLISFKVNDFPFHASAFPWVKIEHSF